VFPNPDTYCGQVLVVVIAIFSTLGLCFVSGLGGILGLYIPKHAAQGYGYADVTHLMTFPSLFMGIGNVVGMPLALAIGRRPVYLGATVLTIFSGVLCATAKTYEWHLAARMVPGLAAGQSEALVPLMVQECHFLHERGRCLMWYSACQCTFSGILTLMTSYIGNAIGADG
jgi:MFS family permease